ncbi:hypothetical protein BKA62DRAFT_719130 [Auriculariales sp. MPI-PUGE-AT-0066]|nr:hypothetical protein BKA62DRAFT_719130 [Auriculariales sp. MPI-PUGE-AT-0066]
MHTPPPQQQQQQLPPQYTARPPRYVPPLTVYKCKPCGARFALVSELSVRMKKHLPVLERPFSCTVCGSKFTTASNVARHMRTLHSAHAHAALSSLVES